MDTDDHHSSRDQHRPPVLLQSDDHYPDPYPGLVQGLAHHSRQSSDLPHLSLGPSQEVPARLSGRQRNYRFGDMSNNYNDDPLDDGGEGKRGGGGSLPDDNEPVHVHSQACQDSCPVQDIYTETSYWRFSKGARTYDMERDKKRGSDICPSFFASIALHGNKGQKLMANPIVPLF